MLFVVPWATTFNKPWLGYVLIPSIMPFLPKKKIKVIWYRNSPERASASQPDMEGRRTSGQCAPKMQGTLSHHQAVRERGSKAALCIQKREVRRHSPGLPIKAMEEPQLTAWSRERLPKPNWASGLQSPQPQNSNAMQKPRKPSPSLPQSLPTSDLF